MQVFNKKYLFYNKKITLFVRAQKTRYFLTLLRINLNNKL